MSGLKVEHCDTPMKWLGTDVTGEGLVDAGYVVTTSRYQCKVCSMWVTVTERKPG